MHQNHPFNSGPISTPKLIKWLIIATAGLTIFSLLFHTLFTQILHLPSPQHILGLTPWGIHRCFLWQFITYLLILPIQSTQLSLGLIIQLFFTVYILWVIGSTLIQSHSYTHFIALYFGGGLLISLGACAVTLATATSFTLIGPMHSIYMLLIAWVFLHPHARLSLFLIISLQAKWVVFGILGFNIFLDFANGNFFSCYLTLLSTIYGYLYSTLAWNSLGPFALLHPLDKKLIFIKRKLLYRLSKRSTQTSKPYSEPKTIDIRTYGLSAKDSAFMDACLEKISKYGKDSLSIVERLRMWIISRKQR